MSIVYGAIGIAPGQLGTLLRREPEGVGKDPHKLLLWLAVPVEVLGYRLPAHLVVGSVFEVSGDVVRSPDGALARQVVHMGAERIQAHARRNESFEDLKEDMDRVLRNTLRPEFVNRIDEVIVFRALDREQIAEIARLLLERTTRRLRPQGIEVEFTEAAVELLAEEGFDPEFGARPLRRTIQRRVDNDLSRMVLDGSLNPGDKVVVGAEESKLTFEVAEGASTVGAASQAETGE